jgi:hypothetical protein
MPLMIVALWVGSLVFGWLHQPVWLITPPVLFLLYVSKQSFEQAQRFRFTAARSAKGRFYLTVAPQILMVVLWNGALNAGIFGLGWFARGFLSPA